MCLLVEVVMCIGPSNAIVEGGFSHLTAMLSDIRLNLAHNTMENLLVKVNDLVWADEEREEVIQSALEKVMSTRRKCKIDHGVQALVSNVVQIGAKRARVAESGSVCSDSDSDTNSSGESSDDVYEPDESEVDGEQLLEDLSQGNESEAVSQ